MGAYEGQQWMEWNWDAGQSLQSDCAHGLGSQRRGGILFDWSELTETQVGSFHLISGTFHFQEHSCRSEGVDHARDLDYKAAAAWIGHPYFDVIDNSTDFETKVNRMIECVCQKLSIDTGDRLLRTSRKLKFLVSGPLRDDLFPSFQDFNVVHHYLQSSGQRVQTRLRKRGQNGHWR